MKRGFLNSKPKGLLPPGPASSSRTASLRSPSDMESLAKAFESLLRTQGFEASAPSESFSQKTQDVLRGSSSASQADLDMGKMQDEIFKRGKKLEYGKVEIAAIPEDYKPADIPIVHRDCRETDHTIDTVLITTIPSKTFTGRLDPDGHSEWIVSGPTKAKVVNTPGYPKPVPKPKTSCGIQPAYVIKTTPDMGLGVFATRDIKMGELIFAERPLLVSPASNIGVPTQLDPKIQDLKTKMAIMMMEWEKMLEIAVGRMEPEDRNAFMELANSHKHDGSGPILGVVRTNGFMVGSNVYDGPEARADGSNAYSGVIKIGSRINHSCMPNVGIVFSTPSFSFQCSAIIDIKAGEELFYSYCGEDQSVAKRQVQLAPYGIVCSCPACKHATPETDKLRTEYHKIAMDYILNVQKVTSSNSKSAAESMIEPVLQFKDALIREGLHYTSDYKAVILVIRKLYESVGKEEEARPYKEEYKRYKLPSEMVNGVMVFKIPEY